MCGIAGFVNIDDVNQKKLIGYANRSRGIGGCGFAWTKPQSWGHTKLKEDFRDALLESASLDVALSAQAMCLHTRKPSSWLGTGASVTKENSHPFHRGDIVLAHNGAFRNCDTLTKELLDKRVLDVDSDGLCALLNTYAPEIIFPRFEGTAAVWWMNKKDPSKFWLWCWDQDLSVWFSEGVDGADGKLAFASEMEQLELAGLTSDNGKIGTVNSSEGNLMEVDTKTAKFTMTQIKGYVAPPVKKVVTKPKVLAPSNVNAVNPSNTFFLTDELPFKLADRVRFEYIKEDYYGIIVGVEKYGYKIIMDGKSDSQYVGSGLVECLEADAKTEKALTQKLKVFEMGKPSSVNYVKTETDILASILNNQSIDVCDICGTLHMSTDAMTCCDVDTSFSATKTIPANVGVCDCCGTVTRGGLAQKQYAICSTCNNNVNIVRAEFEGGVMLQFIKFFHIACGSDEEETSIEEERVMDTLDDDQFEHYNKVRDDFYEEIEEFANEADEKEEEEKENYDKVVTVDCVACDGTGKNTSGDACKVCGGCGFNLINPPKEEVDIKHENESGDWSMIKVKCISCDGSGLDDSGITCPICHGDGEMLLEPMLNKGELE